jgi:hypothetical protein
MAGQTLSNLPLVQATGADAARIEGVPKVAALAHPAIFRAGRPVAPGTANAWVVGDSAGRFIRVPMDFHLLRYFD